MARPSTHWVLVVQLILTVFIGMIGAWFQPNAGLSLFLGGMISVLGQAYFNFRALRSFGDRSTLNVLAATYRAMWGKWVIIIGLSLVLVLKIEYLNAALVFVSLFGVHTLGAFALPILVRRVTK